MIGFLKGRVRDRTGGSLLVDVGGVGFDVVVDRQTLADVPDGAPEVELWVRTVVREDAITLFGFSTTVTRDVFDLLQIVSGVGPKMASQILGGMPLADLVQAVREKDVRRLATINGVGKKTAERLALELADKFMTVPIGAPGEGAPAVPAQMAADLRSALGNLGFGPRDVEVAIKALRPAPRDGLEDLVRSAIGYLARK